MAALDLTNRTAVLAYLTASLPNETVSVLEALLDASAADDCAEDEPVTTYRPFWVIANTLQTNQALAESVGSASGASIKYRDPISAWRAIMRRQAALDKGYCNIPEGFEAVLPGGVGTASLTRAYA
jgi:hypothetical protein